MKSLVSSVGFNGLQLLVESAYTSIYNTIGITKKLFSYIT